MNQGWRPGGEEVVGYAPLGELPLRLIRYKPDSFWDLIMDLGP